MPLNAGAVVYGTILIAALLAAESATHQTYPRTVASVVIALVAYWLTISYSEHFGRRLERGEPFESWAFVHAAIHELSLMVGASVPLIALLILWAAGAALTTAVTAAIWCAVASILAAEVVSGVRAELTGRELAVQVAIGGLLGAMMLAIRVLLY